MATERFLILALQGMIVTHGLVSFSDGYAQCKGLKNKFDGYTYVIDVETGDKLWTHCSFPNPTGDHELCGRSKKSGQYYMCDPDILIQDRAIANTIDMKLQELQTSTSTMCVNSGGRSESFITAIAIIYRILIPDLQSPDLCANECGQLLPTLINTSRPVTHEEKREIMTNFATQLQKTWRIGTCENDVIVLYCHVFGMVKVVAGSRASEALTGNTIIHLQDTFEYYIKEHGFDRGIEEAVLSMLAAIRTSLRGTTPGHIIMYIHIATMIVGGVILFLYVFVRDSHTDVWGGCSIWDVTDTILQFVTGIWLVKGTLLVIANMSATKGQGLYWVLLAACAVFLLCSGMYLVSVYAIHV